MDELECRGKTFIGRTCSKGMNAHSGCPVCATLEDKHGHQLLVSGWRQMNEKAMMPFVVDETDCSSALTDWLAGRSSVLCRTRDTRCNENMCSQHFVWQHGCPEYEFLTVRTFYGLSFSLSVSLFGVFPIISVKSLKFATLHDTGTRHIQVRLLAVSTSCSSHF